MIKGVRGKLVMALLAPAVLIAGYLFAAPAYSEAAVDIPCKDSRGCPDLLINGDKLNSAKLVTRTFTADECAVQEGQVGSAGTRRLLTFPYSTPNMGPGALIIGNPHDPANTPLFEWGACHGHWHFKKYAAYRLWTPAEFTKFQQLKAQNPNTLTDQLIADHGLRPTVGTKRGFCVIDSQGAPEFQGVPDPKTYTECGAGTTVPGNQGISVGWADTYGRKLEGQWIDVTNVPAGDYVLEVEANAQHSFQEANYSNNSASKAVKVTH